jgi:hypothetical protein
MDAPKSWLSDTRTQEEASAAPVSGWEAAMSESIHVGRKLEGEAAALAAIKDHRAIIYLAVVRCGRAQFLPIPSYPHAQNHSRQDSHFVHPPSPPPTPITTQDEGNDVAYEAPRAFETPDLPARGFEGLAALARAGGVDVVRCPLRTELLKTDDAEVVDGILLRLPRPTLIMCT